MIGQAFRAQMGSPVSAVALDDLQTRYASLQQKMADADSAEADDLYAGWLTAVARTIYTPPP